MTALTENAYQVAPNNEIVFIEIDVDATADTADTIAVTLADHGMSTFMGIYGCVHTTANEVVVQEEPTTTVSAGVLTVTIGGSTASNQIRSYLIWGK